jgi:hypothetical protein
MGDAVEHSMGLRRMRQEVKVLVLFGEDIATNANHNLSVTSD